MTKASISLQELRRKIYSKAKTEKHWRFWGLYCHICKKEILEESYRLAKANNGAPGIDGKSFEDIEAEGVEGFLEGIRQELLNRTYRPMPEQTGRDTEGQWKDPDPWDTDRKGPGSTRSAETDTRTDI